MSSIPDNTAQNGTASIATDDVATLNGAASTGVHVQRVKIGRGPDGEFRDAANGYTTGTITAANANLTAGTATAGSAVQIAVPDAHSSWTVFLSGTWTAGTTLHFQGSPDGVNWHPLNGRRTASAAANSAGSVIDADPAGGADTNPSHWRGVAGGIRFFRVTAGPFAAGDSVAVQIVTSEGVGATFLNVGLPPSNNTIGQVAPADGLRSSYTGAINPTGTAGIANALDQWVLQNPAGSGKVVRVTRLAVFVALATAAAGTVSLLRRSTFNTGGTVVAGGRIALDSTNAAPAVTVQGTYSAAPTGSGTLAGILKQERAQLPVVTAAPARFEWLFGTRPSQAVVLRPGEQLSVTVGTLANAAAGTAPTVTGDVEWTEE